jgi:hypothetical protein
MVTGAERINLGITWADIRKGKADIKEGICSRWKKVQIQGERRNSNHFEDIQKANNEYQLTDAEQKQVRENEFESARKYDEDFNSLSEVPNWNYENREDNSERLSQRFHV